MFYVILCADACKPVGVRNPGAKLLILERDPHMQSNDTRFNEDYILDQRNDDAPALQNLSPTLRTRQVIRVRLNIRMMNHPNPIQIQSMPHVTTPYANIPAWEDDAGHHKCRTSNKKTRARDPAYEDTFRRESRHCPRGSPLGFHDMQLNVFCVSSTLMFMVIF